MSFEWSWFFTLHSLCFCLTLSSLFTTSHASPLDLPSLSVSNPLPAATSAAAGVTAHASFIVPAGSNPTKIGALVGIILAVCCFAICIGVCLFHRRKRGHNKRGKRQLQLRGQPSREPSVSSSSSHPKKSKAKKNKKSKGEKDHVLPFHTIDSQETLVSTPSEKGSIRSFYSGDEKGSLNTLISSPMPHNSPATEMAVDDLPKFPEANPIQAPPRAQIAARQKSFKRSRTPPTGAASMGPYRLRSPVPPSRADNRLSDSSQDSGVRSLLSRNGSTTLVRTPSGRFEIERTSVLLSEHASSECGSCSNCGSRSGSPMGNRKDDGSSSASEYSDWSRGPTPAPLTRNNSSASSSSSLSYMPSTAGYLSETHGIENTPALRLIKGPKVEPLSRNGSPASQLLDALSPVISDAPTFSQSSPAARPAFNGGYPFVVPLSSIQERDSAISSSVGSDSDVHVAGGVVPKCKRTATHADVTGATNLLPSPPNYDPPPRPAELWNTPSLYSPPPEEKEITVSGSVLSQATLPSMIVACDYSMEDRFRIDEEALPSSKGSSMHLPGQPRRF